LVADGGANDGVASEVATAVLEELDSLEEQIQNYEGWLKTPSTVEGTLPDGLMELRGKKKRICNWELVEHGAQEIKTRLLENSEAWASDLNCDERRASFARTVESLKELAQSFGYSGLENYACALEKATQEAQSQIDNGAETMEELRKKVTQFGTLLEVYRLLFEQLQNQRIHSLVLAEMLHHSRESEEFLKFLAEFGFGELSGYLTESQFLESRPSV